MTKFMMSPPAPEHSDRRVASTMLEPGPVRAANDSKPAAPANDSMPREAASDPKPAKPASDEETVELQIAALLSAWDKTSLCARRAFLTRIDQRMMTTHRIRSASRQFGQRGGDRLIIGGQRTEGGRWTVVLLRRLFSVLCPLSSVPITFDRSFRAVLGKPLRRFCFRVPAPCPSLE